jgi:hypothetical protein
MEPNIPIPTDNIYKFSTLFALAVFIATIPAMAYLIGKQNELFFKSLEDLLLLETQENLSKADLVKKVILERHLNINVFSLSKYIYALWAINVIAVIVFSAFSVYWSKNIQPKQDEFFNLQIEKIKREIQILDKQLEKKETE